MKQRLNIESINDILKENLNCQNYYIIEKKNEGPYYLKNIGSSNKNVLQSQSY